MTGEVPHPGQRVPGAPDCTIVVDTVMRQGKPLAHSGVADSAKDIASVAGSSCSRPSSSDDALDQQAALAAAAAAAGAGAGAAAPAAAAAAAAPARAPRPRTYYVDWLRVFLTVLVVVHHCVTMYQSSYAWAGKRGDTALWLLSQLFVGANQAYFMTLFFFLSGLYVTGSYRRKGPGHFLWDRTLRLVVPCIVYSFVAPPFILMLNETAKNPKANVFQVWATAYRGWLKPGWPSTYVLPTGPPWFVWMLWCFNVAYVILKVAGSVLPASCRRARNAHDDSAASLTQLPTLGTNNKQTGAGGGSSKGASYTTRQMLAYTSALTMVLFAVCFGARMLDTFMFNVRPTVFVQRGPFVSFMPDFLPVYAAAFALGIYAGPLGVLARLPDAWGSWALCVAGVWWMLGGWLLNVTLHSWMSMQHGTMAFVLTWLLRTFVEQSFCVFWSVGLLVVFRRAYNVQPNWFGRQAINGAYGAYLVHLPLVCLFARLFIPFTFPSAVVNAVIITPFTVAAAWILACLMRAVPGADKVL